MITNIPESVQKKLLFLIVSLLLAGFMLANNIIVSPFVSKLKSLYSEQTGINYKRQLVQEIGGLDKKLGSYKSSFPENKQVSWFIEELNKMAEQSSVSLTSIAPVNDENRGDYQKSIMKLETQCTYHELGDFVSRIESSSRFIKISGFRAELITEGKKVPGKNIRAILSISFFYPAKVMAK